MRRNLAGAVMLSLAVFTAGSAYAGDVRIYDRCSADAATPFGILSVFSFPQMSTDTFRVVRLDWIDRDEASRIYATVSPARMQAVQSEIRSDPTTESELCGLGININNIVSSQRAANGKTIYYLR